MVLLKKYKHHKYTWFTFVVKSWDQQSDSCLVFPSLGLKPWLAPVSLGNMTLNRKSWTMKENTNVSNICIFPTIMICNQKQNQPFQATLFHGFRFISYKNEAGFPGERPVGGLNNQTEAKTEFRSYADSQSGSPPGDLSGNTPTKPHCPSAYHRGHSQLLKPLFLCVSDRKSEAETKWEKDKRTI